MREDILNMTLEEQLLVFCLRPDDVTDPEVFMERLLNIQSHADAEEVRSMIVGGRWASEESEAGRLAGPPTS